MGRRIANGLAIFVMVASLGAAQRPATSSGSSSTQDSKTQQAETAALHAKLNHRAPYQVGTASWYGKDFQGKVTASGEPYNMYDLTAAHLELPLGTLVRVTNLRNRHTVIVRINDRGPVVAGRIIDLSYSAARVLGMKAHGVQRVRLDVVPPQMLAALEPVAVPPTKLLDCRGC